MVLTVAWGNVENRDDLISRTVTYYQSDAESGTSFGTEFSFDATTMGSRSSHTRTFSMGNSYEIIETVSEESEQEEKEEHGGFHFREVGDQMPIHHDHLSIYCCRHMFS